MNGKKTKKQRREEIRQARIEAQRRRMRAKRRRQMLTWGLAGLVALTGAGFGLWRSIEGRRTVQTEAEKAGCTDIEKLEELPAIHIDSADAPPSPPAYNSTPPTSGPHLGAQTAPAGSQADTIPPEVYVHNLEHGQIVIHYKDLPEDEIEILEMLADDVYEAALIVMPNESIDEKVVMTSWAHMQSCDKASEQVVRNFVSERCGKGPEAAGISCLEL